ncbi:MAG: ABC transporter permease [Planctomycetales bacterium]
MNPTSPETKVTVIDAQGRAAIPWDEIWAYRELFWIVALRDLKVRYKQTLAGIVWVILQPALTTLLFLGFLRLYDVQNYSPISQALIMFSGLILWRLYSNTVTTASESVVASQALITKVYFPRIILPASSLLPAYTDFAVGVVILIGLMFFLPCQPGFAIVLAPLFVFLLSLQALAIGIWMSALNSLYRDIRQIVPFAMQLGMFLCPVFYSSARVPEKWRWLYDLIPNSALIDGFRWGMMGGPAPSLVGLLWSLAFTGGVMWTGILYFRWVERKFADVV